MTRPVEIREFIKTIIRQVMPRSVESQNPHTPDTVGAMKYDQSYYVAFNSIAFTSAQGYSEISLPVDIEIGKKGGTDPIAAHDDILNDALDIATRISNNSNNQDQFATVNVTSVTPEPVLDNERWTKVTISTEFIIHC